MIETIRQAFVRANELRFVRFPGGVATLEPCEVVRAIEVPRKPVSVPPECNGFQIWDSTGCIFAARLSATYVLDFDRLYFEGGT